MQKTLTVKTTFCAVVMFLILAINANATIVYSTASGNWNSGAIWSTLSEPDPGDSVVINGHTVTVNTNTNIIGTLTIQVNATNGKVVVSNLATASLNISYDIIVNPNCSLENNGKIDLFFPAPFVLGANATYIHNPRANTLSDESMFELGAENFDPTSNLIVLKWASLSFALGQANRLNGNIGNLETSVAGVWEMNGTLAPNRVKGYLKVHAGTLHMDDGTGLSTSLQLQDVTIDGTGAIVFQDGGNRNFTFTCNNFTDISTNNAQPTGFMALLQNSGFGKLKWIANGNVVLNHEFIGINGTASENMWADTIIINGNLTIGGAGFTGNCIFHKQVNCALYMNVAGTTSILGNPGYVRFVDSGNGYVNFNTANLVISGGAKNTFLGGNEVLDGFGNPAFPLPSATATVNVTNDITINGASVTHVMLAPTNVQKTRVNVGGNFSTSIFSADFRAAKSIGPVSVIVGNNLSMTGGYFDAQNNSSSNAVDSVIVGGDFLYNSAFAANYFRANTGAGSTVFRTTGNFTITTSGTGVNEGVCGNFQGNGNLQFYVGGNFTLTAGSFRGIKDGDGNLDFTVVGTFSQAAGIFRAIYNQISGTSGASTLNIGTLNFNGGLWSQFYASNSVAVATVCNIVNNLSINFANVSDQFTFNTMALVGSNNNQARLNLNVGGNMTFGGTNGTFFSSLGFGPDSINVTGNMSFNGGNNSFNATHYSIYPNFHPVVISVGGDMNVSNGDNYLSAYVGQLTVTINGNLTVSGGSLTFKGDGFGDALINILGGYDQTNGNVYLYNNTLFPNLYDIIVNINSNDDPTGNFSHTGGSIVLDNNANSQHLRELNIKSPTYTLGGNGLIYRANAGVSVEFGTINFNRTGTTLFSRTSNTHMIQQVKQKVFGLTTLDVISGNVQIASHNNTGIPFFETTAGAVVTLRLNSQIYSNSSYPNSYVYIISGSRLRTQSIYGLYDGTVNAAFSSAGNLTYVLGASSTVEYFGNDNQIITGIGIGTATSGNQKYGNLEINFTGTPYVEFVSPISIGTVNVRNNLILTNGELNLDSDHNPVNSGGRILRLDNGAPTAISRTNGYIRAEINDASGMLKWMVGASTALHTVPFGYYTGTTFYLIPVNYTGLGGSSGEVSFSTFHTTAANLPYPPAVGHVNSAATGLDNSANCVDRFWYINRTGTITSFNLSFTLPGTTENPASAFTQLRAQHYNYGNGGWDSPFQGSQVWTAGTFNVSVTNATDVNDWWTMVNQTTPLPVSLLNFSAECYKKNQLLKWSTAAEVNNNFFTLEKSNDGKEYSVLTTLKGMGTTNQITNYEFTDDNSNSPLAYYRLSQTDFDGQSKTFNPIASHGCNASNVLTIISTHADESNVKAVVNAPADGAYSLKLINIAGKLVYSGQVNLFSGINTLPISSSSLSNGIYMINLDNGVSTVSKNVVVNR